MKIRNASACIYAAQCTFIYMYVSNFNMPRRLSLSQREKEKCLQGKDADRGSWKGEWFLVGIHFSWPIFWVTFYFSNTKRSVRAGYQTAKAKITILTHLFIYDNLPTKLNI